MTTKMQAKDIPERPVLEFLKVNWPCNWYGNEFERSVTRAMPDGTPLKVALAKMRSLEKRGLITGCCCGCRGDFKLSVKGHRLLDGGE